MTRLLTRIGGALLLSLPLLATAGATGQDYRLKLPPNPQGATPVITRLYGQNLLFFVPPRFVLLGAQEQDGSYSREYVLKGESGAKWTQMIRVSATRGIVGQAGVTPRGVLAVMAQAMKDDCPTTFAAADLGETEVSGFPAQIAALGCGAEGPHPPAWNEQNLTIVLQGMHDLYTVQWLERSAPARRAPVLDREVLARRAGTLMPLRLCDSDPQQNPPFADCLRAPAPLPAAPLPGLPGAP